jgi:hypothetical protein
LSTYLRLGLPSGLFPSGFPTNILYAFLFSPIRATYTPNPTIHYSNIIVNNIHPSDFRSSKWPFSKCFTTKKSVRVHHIPNERYMLPSQHPLLLYSRGPVHIITALNLLAYVHISFFKINFSIIISHTHSLPNILFHQAFEYNFWLCVLRILPSPIFYLFTLTILCQEHK